ncbi:MAG: hypothetical protein KDA89_14435 [Planctomycetaceae bacterium]|nr:hypothetical protein [Planctomycetaceae bacterium]
MTDDARVSEWLRELQDPGKRDDAARRIFDTYARQLLALIRRNLSSDLAGRIEELDIMQSVFGSFFRCSDKVPDGSSVFGLLVDLALKKTRSVARYHYAQKRSVRAESAAAAEQLESARRPVAEDSAARQASIAPEPEESAASPEFDSWFDLESLELLALGATPEQAMAVIDIFTSLPDELKPVISLKIEGLSEDAIAKRLNWSRRKVSRRLDLIRRILEQRRTFEQDIRPA